MYLGSQHVDLLWHHWEYLCGCISHDNMLTCCDCTGNIYVGVSCVTTCWPVVTQLGKISIGVSWVTTCWPVVTALGVSVWVYLAWQHVDLLWQHWKYFCWRILHLDVPWSAPSRILNTDFVFSYCTQEIITIFSVIILFAAQGSNNC